MVLSNCLTRGSWLHALSQYSESKIRTDPYNTSSSKKKEFNLIKFIYSISVKKKARYKQDISDKEPKNK